MLAFSLTGVAWSRFYAGNWPGARGAQREAMDLIRGLPPSWQLPFLLYTGGLIEAHVGEWDAASSHLQQAIDVCQGSHVVMPLVHGVLAEHEIVDGCPDLARARLQPLIRDHSEHDVYIAMMLPTLVWAYIELEEFSRADSLVARLLEGVGLQRRLVLVDALRMQGMLLARRGKQVEAERAFDEAVTLARSMPCPYAGAMTLYEWGVMGLAAGDRAAPDRLRAALETFRGLGARPAIVRTESALAQAGRRNQP